MTHTVDLTNPLLETYTRENVELKQALLDMVAQNCEERGDRTFHSGYISAHAGALRVLARTGVMTLSDNVGRTVIAKINDQWHPFGNGPVITPQT